MSFFSSLGKIAGIVAAPFTDGSSLLATGLSAGASLLGGVLQNNSAKSIANNNNAAAIELANTAHQREVKDLEAAGLNPILSAGGSGSATPAMQAAPVQNVLGGVASSALQTATAMAQLKQIKAETAKTIQDTRTATSNAEIAKNNEIISTNTMGSAISSAASAAASADAAARSSGVQADSDVAMGAIMKSLGSGSATASNFAKVLQVLRSLPSGR